MPTYLGVRQSNVAHNSSLSRCRIPDLQSMPIKPHWKRINNGRLKFYPLEACFVELINKSICSYMAYGLIRVSSHTGAELEGAAHDHHGGEQDHPQRPLRLAASVRRLPCRCRRRRRRRSGSARATASGRRWWRQPPRTPNLQRSSGVIAPSGSRALPTPAAAGG